jgi:hypothetical protein
MAKGVATANLNFFKNILKKKKKNCGQYGKFWIQLIKLQKFGTLGGRVDCKN